MSDVLERYDRLRDQDPEQLAELLSRIPEMDRPGRRRSGSRRRGVESDRPVVEMPKNPHVRRFIRYPRQEIGKDYTKTPEFGWDLLRYCSEYLDAIPAQARGFVSLVCGIYERYAKEGVAGARCLSISAAGVLAFGDYHLGKIRSASAKLDEIAAGIDCSGCEAAMLRRSALFAIELGRRGLDPAGFETAIDKTARALDLYLLPDTPDHDLLGNGAANTRMTRSLAFRYARRHDAAMDELRAALELCSPKKSPRLYRHTLFNTAATLLDSGSPENLLLAGEISSRARKLVSRHRKPSLERATAFWLEGQIHGCLDRPREGISELERARDDFVALEAASSACAVTADLIRLATESGHERVGEYVAELGERDKWIPRRLRHAVTALIEVWERRADRDHVLAAAARLRKACEGPMILPSLI